MEMDHILIHCCCCFFFFAAAVLVGVSNAHEDLHFKHLTRREQLCDLFRGEWIFNPSDPPYSDKCHFLYDPQNCLKNHRPDITYLHWRWKPYGCHLPLFDPEKFLNLLENKVFAFIGDSIVRNQKESLLCLLSKVEEPSLVQAKSDQWDNTWFFPSYNFTVMTIRSHFLLRQGENEDRRGVFELHLDVLDDRWTDLYHKFDYVIIGTGAWFDNPGFMLENNTVIGCHRCKMEGVPELGQFYPYRRALNLAFRFIVASDHKPFVIYRIHAPNHFEHGLWNTGGYCNRTVPFEEADLVSNFREDYRDEEYERISREEYAKATMAFGATHRQEKSGVRLEMLDMYHLSLLRPDGHPNAYRGDGKRDCLHWCAPGVIDTWNDLMMEMILREKDQLGTSLKVGGHVI